MIDVEPTAEVIDNMMLKLHETSITLSNIAHNMREKSDLSYASETINCVSNLMLNLRLDLLVSRPIRELLKGRED